jgi:cytidine deaminase
MNDLIEAAGKARERAYAPYSQFLVGAAVSTMDGQIFSGCNVENSSYGLTICAERTAIFKAVSEGQTAITGLAVVADTEQVTPPCGACRQVMWEVCGDIPVVLANLEGELVRTTVSKLLPVPFDENNLIRRK